MSQKLLKCALSELIKNGDSYQAKFSIYLHEDKVLTEAEIKTILKSLSKLILTPESAVTVARCFPQLVLQLLTLGKSHNDNKHEKKNEFLALGQLVTFHPDARRFAVRYFEGTSSLFTKLSKKLQEPELSLVQLEILRCCINFLKTSNEHFRHSKNWSPLFGSFLQSSNVEVKWLTCQCIATVTGMSDRQRRSFALNHLSADDVDKYTVDHDAFRLPPPPGVLALAGGADAMPTLSGAVVSGGGIQLPVFDPSQVQKSWFLAADDFNLLCLALAIANGKAACLKGPVGCGKTALVEHLAKLTGRTAPHFLKVQLGDQTDSKMLLGTYQCTDVPGEFVWTPGVLTQAVVQGHWLLLEDVDSAAIDVATILSALLETGCLSVPGYGDSVRVSPGFQLFVTQRLLGGHHRQQSAGSSLLEKHLVQIGLDSLDYAQLVVLVETMFERLRSVSTRMVDVFWTLKEATELSGNARRSSTRDLIKWCSRNVQSFDVASRDSTLKIYQDALDIFCANVANPATKARLAVRIAACLGLTEAQADYYCHTYKPNIAKTNTKFVTGRAQSDIVAEVSLRSGPRSNFSFTRPASCLLESIACCVNHREPVLLVGETGTGKTSTVQYLAECSGRRLVVINMNQQSDSADLLGGYKPVDVKYVVHPLMQDFEMLLRRTLTMAQIGDFIAKFGILFNQHRWQALSQTFKQIQTVVVRKLSGERPINGDLVAKWSAMGEELVKLDAKLKNSSAMAFAFIEGSLVQALREGWWVLLDEINLASAETLECLSGLLEGSAGSLHMLERGDKEAISRHPQFRLFACMNPATDVGKKELPVGLRNRFTEFYVDELTEHLDLMQLVGTYLRGLSLPDAKLDNLVKFYLKIRTEAKRSLSDGTGHKPHYSLRTLCRALSIAAKNKCGSAPRSLYEALCVSFLTQLDNVSHPVVEQMISVAVTNKKVAKSVLHNPIPEPPSIGRQRYVNFEGYWVSTGRAEPTLSDKYILTPSVRRNLRDLVRVVSIGRLPVLIQGETSVGKTSLITYLAEASGNRCVRINNHEHTDLQEYVGSYCADDRGRLVFKEGVLVEAMRKGDWIILDELNLAPSDVLEALNRVLDDNRELFIPETRETVRAHPQFMLFATQNPPGLYGGRKMLSRAFRNRFVELHFNEIPPAELETILHLRCDLPPSYCKKLVAVMTELQVRRKGSSAFAGKQGFITLRDLFRWGERYRLANEAFTSKVYDWDQHIADEGYLILAGRVRRREEAEVIRQVLQIHIKRQVDPERLFTLSDETSPVTRQILERLVVKPHPDFAHVVWTFNMRRLAVLVAKAVDFQEPVLLVGETGCGKTTICQLLAANQGQELHSVNCHMHTESSDFLGGLRPVRDHASSPDGPRRLFEWVDGPLIKAMQHGDLFLADEISLADDSVLERLNSLLEPERTLLLAEKGGDDRSESSVVVKADDRFHFVGTMNPGGDYGKKELSPALRNRFTEIWCEGCTDRADLLAVIEHNLRPGLSLGNQQDGTSGIGHCLLAFVQWFTSTDIGKRFTVSIRDILSWVNFINVCTADGADAAERKLELTASYVHGAFLTFLDGLGSGVTSSDSAASLKSLRNSALRFLTSQTEGDIESTASIVTEVFVNDTLFGIPPFYVERGPEPVIPNAFTFAAPTTGLNACRVLRGMQLAKPILLEGSPGVGKTALVEALAKASGHRLVRINLSDQTDVCDMFGADLPVEGGEGGQFAWKDGPFLQALKAGHWILIDELNLASQSVLEGLNACLDHRGEVFIPELGRTFRVRSGTRLFGAQNPVKQGGARRGLPKSFLNRFTQVYVDSLSDHDLEFIAVSLFPAIPREMISLMVRFNSRLVRETSELRLWGYRGSPWEFNLRDLSRWCEATVAMTPDLNPGRFVDLVYVDRMRTQEDRDKVKEIYAEVFGPAYPLRCDFPRVHVTPDTLYVGDVALSRHTDRSDGDLLLLRGQCRALRSLARCVAVGWLAVVVGPADSGKTSVVRLLAQLAGRTLRVLSVNSAMDTTEVLGGFEQVDYMRLLEDLSTRLERVLYDTVRVLLVTSEARRDADTVAQHLLAQWEAFRRADERAPGEEDSKQQQHGLANYTRISSTLREVLDYMKTIPAPLVATLGDLGVLDVLVEELDKLDGKVRQAGSLNAGGKFHWCDSVLVKCLVEGSWLLVDNVNLCSPAVLDRLNALLEPGGILTVGERGVGPNGELVTYKPHPDFRLFMALDPRHGEISRAMRNRGIEIHVGSTELDQPLDTRSLLTRVGLTDHAHQARLLDLHSADRDLPGRPARSSLLRAGFLLREQTVRGRPFEEVFARTCREVYARGRDEDTPPAPTTPVGTEAFSFDIATPDTGELRENSAFYSARQAGTLLVALLRSTPLASTAFLNALAGPSPSLLLELPLLDLTRHLLVAFYSTCSHGDAKLRHAWLKRLSDQVDATGRLAMLSHVHMWTVKVYHEKRGLVSSGGDPFLPWDRRWLPDLSLDPGPDSEPNKLSLILELFSRLEFVPTDRSSNILSVQKYSESVKSRTVSNSFAKHALVILFSELVTQLRSWLRKCLALETTSVDNATWAALYHGLYWYFEFARHGQLPVQQKRKNKTVVDEDSLNVLGVYFKWLWKRFWPELRKLMQQSQDQSVSKALVALSHAMGTVESSLPQATLPLLKIGKLMRRELGQPLPFTTEEQANLTGRLRRLSDLVDVWSIKSSDAKISAMLGAPAKEFRAKLIAANLLLMKATDLDRVSELVSELESLHGALLPTPPTEGTEDVARTPAPTAQCIARDNARVQLWPLQERLALALTGRQRRLLLERLAGAELQPPAEVLGAVASLPPRLVAACSLEPGDTEALRRSSPETLATLMRHTSLSPAVRNARAWAAWERGRDIEEPLEGKEDSYPLHCPLLTMLVMDLTLPDREASTGKPDTSTDGMSTLGAQEARKQQLCAVQQVLWRNSLGLSSEELDFVKNDVAGCRAAYARLVASLTTVMDRLVPLADAPPSPSVPRLLRQLADYEGRFHGGHSSLTSFVDCLRELEADVGALGSTQEPIQVLTLTGKVWSALGYLGVAMFGHLSKVDPVVKRQMKVKCATQELAEIRKTLYAYELQARVSGYSLSEVDEENQHPFIREFQRRAESLRELERKLRQFVAYRPQDSSFADLTKSMFHYSKTLASASIVLKIQKKMVDAIEYESEAARVDQLLNSASNWQNSQHWFVDRVAHDFAMYPDMVQPLLLATTQLCYGISLLSSTLRKMTIRRKMAVDDENHYAAVEKLAVFPSESLPDTIENNTSGEMRHILQTTLDPELTAKRNYRMIKCSLEDLRNYIIVRGELDARSWHQLNDLLDQIVSAWKAQELAKEEAKIAEDSMFITKSATRSENLTDEEQVEQDMKELFPSTSETDFGDLQKYSSLEYMKASLEVGPPLPLITDEDIDDVCVLHSEVIQLATKTHWLAAGGRRGGALEADYISPFLERMETFRCLMSRLSRGCDGSLDRKLLPGLAVLTAATLNAADGAELTRVDSPAVSPSRSGGASRVKSSAYDFYRHPRVDEVKECLPILEKLTLRVQELLCEWPEHPTLNQIITIVNRILGFPVVSPVSRFLTGLELLLTKLQEWEENAHKGVSLSPQMQSVTHQIIAWRKLELNVWKDFLANTAKKVKARASKWWFHIYSLTDSFVNLLAGASEIDSKSLIDALESFVKISSLGEFEARLDLLYSFHCHMAHLEPSSRRNELLSILWNLHGYYSQFAGNVALKISQLRAPIEKKLRDFVKIARWNDISYWAIKETVEKTHRTLLKHIKEFEGVLKQPVANSLLNVTEETTSIHDGFTPNRALRNQQKHYLVPSQFVAATALKEFISRDETIQSDLLDHMAMFFSKSRKLCKEAILASSYPRLIQTVDGLVADLIDSANQLKNMEVSKDLTKEKQKSQAKSFLQQKRKALADLFKTLQTLGLSYRTGLADWAVDDTVNVWTLPPIDIKAALHHLKTRRADYQLLSVWEGCEEYFWKFSARMCLLNNAMLAPSKDLGPPNLERIKGFSIHLMRTAQEQKLEVFTTSDTLFELRCQISQLQALEDDGPDLQPSQADIRLWLGTFQDLLVSSLLCLEQFLLLLSSCPVPSACPDDLEMEVPVLGGGPVPKMAAAHKGDGTWELAAHRVRHLVATLAKMKAALDKVKPKKFSNFSSHVVCQQREIADSGTLVSPAQYRSLIAGFAQLESVVGELGEVRAMFEDGPARDEVTPSETIADEASAMITEDVPSKTAGDEASAMITDESPSDTIADETSAMVTDESPPKAATRYPRNPMADGLRSLECSLTDAVARFKSELERSPRVDTTAVDSTTAPIDVELFKLETEKLMQTVLFAIQRVYKRYSVAADVAPEPEVPEKEEEDVENPIEENHLNDKILKSLNKDLDDLSMRKVNDRLSALTRALADHLNVEGGTRQAADVCKRLLLRCVPCLEQLTLLGQFFLTQQVAAYRVSSKLLSVLLAVFLNLTAKGFCIPSNLMPQEEGGESQPTGGMGLGEGEGEKDVSDRIDSQDDLEDARPQGEERKDDDKDCKEEEKGVEMSDDFGGKAQELEEKEKDEDEESGPEEEEPDKEMGETEEGADKLDQQIWGEDSEPEDEEDGEGDEKEGEERGSGEKTEEPELSAKDDKSKPGEEDVGEGNEEEEQKKKKKEINEMDEPELDDNQVDPYHGKHAPEEEPEELDLPDDLQLDEGEAKDGEAGEDNPFDIDDMKDQQPPPEDEAEPPPEGSDKPEEKPEDSSDEEVEEGDLKKGEPEPMETEEPPPPETQEEGAGKQEEGEEESEGRREEEKATPSDDAPSTDPVQPAEQMEVDGSRDEVACEAPQEQTSTNQTPEESTETPRDEKDGVGQAQTKEQQSGHEGKLSSNQDISRDKYQEPRQEKKRKPGQSDSSRSLGDVNEPVNKKLKTMDRKQQEDEEDEDEGEEGDKPEERGEKSDVYQHIRDAEETFDAQTLDAANREQAEKNPVPNQEGEDGEEVQDEDDIEMEDEEPPADEATPKQDPERTESESKRPKRDKRPVGDDTTDADKTDAEVTEVDGEKVDTMEVERGAETTFHTVFGEISERYEPAGEDGEENLRAMRLELEAQLATWTQAPPTAEAEKAWELFSVVTEDLARNLSEQLRLVLEPTQASRLRGDYRTGRRINMRKVIPYIASHFRKDKIWLRRTKPSKREYQIVLAIDDSSSMADNHSKELAFESLAVVSKALTLLEAGELAVVSFGETPKVLHQLGEPFNEQSGARLLQQFSFSQQQTRLGQLVDFVSSLLDVSASSRTPERSQLLVIVSDGRGVFSEGPEKVKQAVRQAKLAGLFMVFIIVDNPETKNSILDIRVPSFQDGKVTISPYLDGFPFPFYLILRDINALPAVLSEALRQWFELVTNMDLK